MLRDYQLAIRDNIVNSTARNILAVLPTGAGKTVIMADILKTLNVPAISIAHRQELVSQISIAMARAGVEHNIIAPDAIIKGIIRMHHREFGASYYRADSLIACAGVDTLIRRDVSRWCDRVELWEMDEAHHMQPGNKWGKAAAMFPRARGVGWTATPVRSDGGGLDQCFDAMVVGPSMRDLINREYLAEYRIYGPQVTLDKSALKIGATGDYTQSSLTTETERASITGDIVAQYLKHAAGKRGVTFAASVKLAEEYAAAYRAAGVPAACVDGKTPDADRADMIAGLKSGELLQLTNMDIFGEGFDLPAIECASMARATASYSLFCQQFGRALRPAPGKSHGIIIDHVGNVMQHGLPDTRVTWSLRGRDRAACELPGDEVEIPIRQCIVPACLAVYASWSKRCPECGNIPAPAAARDPCQVDGDLAEYSDDLLRSLRGEIAAVMRSAPPTVPAYVQSSVRRRIEAQTALRDCIASWAGYWRDVHGAADREIYQRFFKSFGVDIMTAQTLRPAAAEKLRGEIVTAELFRKT